MIFLDLMLISTRESLQMKIRIKNMQCLTIKFPPCQQVWYLCSRKSGPSVLLHFSNNQVHVYMWVNNLERNVNQHATIQKINLFKKNNIEQKSVFQPFFCVSFGYHQSITYKYTPSSSTQIPIRHTIINVCHLLNFLFAYNKT